MSKRARDGEEGQSRLTKFFKPSSGPREPVPATDASGSARIASQDPDAASDSETDAVAQLKESLDLSSLNIRAEIDARFALLASLLLNRDQLKCGAR